MTGFSFEVKNSNVKKILDSVKDEIPVILEKCGLVAEGYAKRLCPVDTGRLRNSITYEVSDAESTMYLGTNVEYAPYVEMGTSRTRAQPFIKPALADNVDTYRNIIEDHLSRVLH